MTADGKKMGKTESGSIFLDSAMVTPYEMYQYWRNMPDQDVEKFLLTFTFLPVDECRRLGSMEGPGINDAKEVLALEATALIHGRNAAEAARETSRSAFGASGSSAADATAMPVIEVSAAKLADGIAVLELFAMTGLCSSRSEARRLVQQGGARINDVQITDVDRTIDSTWVKDGQLILRAGKKRFFRVTVQ